MATYKEIKGTTVKVRSSSMPTTYPQVAGELYYNSSNGKYEFLSSAVGAWSSGGNLGTARQGITGAGIQTAGFAYGGQGPAAPLALSQQYDGTSWITSASLGTARYSLDGLGETQAESMAFGGGPAQTGTEEFTPESTALNIKTITTS